MMNTWKLPTSVQVAGVAWDIETDFRVVIDVLVAVNNPEYDDTDKLLYMLMAMIKDFDSLSEECYEEASKELTVFIDMGIDEDSNKNSPILMDWEQDASLIVPAVNKVIGHEVRAESYMHWWTFLSAYMEIGECSFAHIVSIRNKMAKHKKLEKWEEEFVRENKYLVNLKKKMSHQDEAEKKALEELLG